MLKLLFKLLLLYFLWVLVLRPSFSWMGQTSDSWTDCFGQIYWWMSPGQDGWR